MTDLKNSMELKKIFISNLLSKISNLLKVIIQQRKNKTRPQISRILFFCLGAPVEGGALGVHQGGATHVVAVL